MMGLCLTSLPAEGAELNFYIPELALQGDADRGHMLERWLWAGSSGCWGKKMRLGT